MKRWACHACTASGSAVTSNLAREAFLRHYLDAHQEVDF
jgi:hypothetical protein